MSDFALAGIIDSTLREGEQRTGIIIDYQAKLEIVDKLAELGIEEIEAGVSSPRSPELLSFVPAAKKITQGRTRISLWCRCHQQDIFFAHRCNPDTLSLSIPVSDILIREKLGQNRKWVLERLDNSISEALRLGFKKISVGLEDATRADREFLFRVADLINNSGAERLRLADTVGIASPQLISDLVTSTKETVSISVGVHTHNDFGMATANAVSALEAGADWVDATVLGLGERTGNCRLEEVVGYLALQKNIKRYDITHLKTLCDKVANAAQTTIHSHHPVIGEQIFTCESGLHVHALAQNPKTYEPYDPLKMGSTRTLLFGSKTGKRAIQKTLDAAGMYSSNEEIESLVDEIRLLAQSGTKPLAENELISFVQQRMRVT